MPILAHGALGAFDELIFLGVAVIFLVAMGVSWVRSRYSSPPVEDRAPGAPADASTADSHDHFPLS